MRKRLYEADEITANGYRWTWTGKEMLAKELEGLNDLVLYNTRRMNGSAFERPNGMLYDKDE